MISSFIKFHLCQSHQNTVLTICRQYCACRVMRWRHRALSHTRCVLLMTQTANGCITAASLPADEGSFPSSFLLLLIFVCARKTSHYGSSCNIQLLACLSQLDEIATPSDFSMQSASSPFLSVTEVVITLFPLSPCTFPSLQRMASQEGEKQSGRKNDCVCMGKVQKGK